MVVDPWTPEEVTRDAGLHSVWGSHESMEDLKHKLLCANMEIEMLRANAKEEIRKSEESIKQLIHLLQVVSHERDAARDQLQLLLNKITKPHMQQTRTSSSITESDSLSRTPTHNSYGASPLESFFNSVASPELSSIQMEINSSYDIVSAIIGELVMKKPLPQKGKLLQAVLEAGPTLQTLLLAGPLPQWRNPPPSQPFQVPPVDFKSHSASLINQKLLLNPNNLVQSSANLFNHEKFSAGATSLCPRKRELTLPCMRNHDTMKRQKTQCTGSV